MSYCSISFFTLLYDFSSKTPSGYFSLKSFFFKRAFLPCPIRVAYDCLFVQISPKFAFVCFFPFVYTGRKFVRWEGEISKYNEVIRWENVINTQSRLPIRRGLL